MSKLLGFGIIGCGAVASAHAYGIAHAPNAILQAVVDKVESKAKKFGEDHNVDWYVDYNRLLKRDDVDVVNVCTSHGTHADITIAAAKRHKHVIVEKPIEINLEKADRMIAACRDSGVKLAIISQRRFSDTLVQLKRTIEKGEIGRIFLASMYSKCYRSQEYYEDAKWRGTRDGGGGGALIGQAVYGVDLLYHLVGPVESVSAYSATLAHEIEVEDTAVVIARFRSGALGMIEATTSTYPGSFPKIEIYGELGGSVLQIERKLELKFKNGTTQVFREKEDKNKNIQWSTSAVSMKGHKRQIEDMVNAINEDREPVVNGEEGKKSLKIVLAAYESARTGVSVSLLP